MFKWILGFFLLSLISCQQKPTVGVTDSGVLVQNKDYRKVILENSIVFDTRSPFEFNTTKVPGSINLPISDFQSSKDTLDAARRLSLYGVNTKSSVVIIGEGFGDEQKLAWEFIKLGVTKIETLKASVFRLLNVKPEAPKKNVTLWKPDTAFGELNTKSFDKKMESLRPKPTSGARAKTFQGFPVASALKKRVLVVTLDKEWAEQNKYPYADHMVFTDQNLFDDKGLLNKTHKVNADLKKYDVVFLIDSTMQKFSHAYALVQLGPLKSFYLVY